MIQMIISQKSESFKFKTKITGKNPDADNKKNVEIAIPLK